MPTLPEILIVVGMIALGILAFLILSKLLLTYNPAQAEADDAACVCEVEVTKQPSAL